MKSYYVFTCHFPQGKGKTEACLMAESLDGAFEVREIIEDDLSFHGYGVAQGGMVDTPDGDWYAFMMQDRGGVGRVPILMPMRFGEDGFPVVGENGKVPQSVSVPAASCAEPVTPINGSEFIARHNAEGGVDANCLQPYWQFNHIPHNEYWSLTERPGAFRLHSGRISSNLNHAWNTLTQRTMGPVTVAEVTVDASTLHDGDFAGLAAFQGCSTKFVHRNSFNIASMSFDPEIIYNNIKKYVPDFQMEYDVDPLRQAIAESWPNSLDDTCAREEWGWKPEYDLDSMTQDMLAKLKERFNK